MRSLKNTARCGRSSAAQAPRGCLAAPLVEEPSVAVARRSSCAPPPPWPWWLSSGSVERRSAARCGASQLPGPRRSTAARVATTSAVVALDVVEQLLSQAVRWPSLPWLHCTKER